MSLFSTSRRCSRKRSANLLPVLHTQRAGYAIEDIYGDACKVVSDLADRLGPEILTVLEIKGQVLHHVRLHVKVPGWLLNLNALLTKHHSFFRN